jgi:hypothetical protein
VIVVLLVLQVIFIMPAQGITQAIPDEQNTYSNTGVFGYRIPGETDIRYRCSGILIDPTHFLTAAHCMAWLVGTNFPIFVSFDPNIGEGLGEATVIEALSFTVHPLFGHDQANLYDLAIITLPYDSTSGLVPAMLSTASFLDEMANIELRAVEFLSVGYGLQADWKGGPTLLFWDGWRNYSFAPLMALTPTQIYLNINEDATEGGGACYGDSGGPIFLPKKGQLILVGITTLRSDRNCRAMTTYYRIDTPWSREFLGQFVTLP